MKNYETMSDFEINRAVACRLDGNDLDIFGRPMFASDCYFSVPSESSVEWHQFGCDESKLFDPCNNPSDAWPIIFSSRTMLNPYCTDELWKAEVPCGFDGFVKEYATCYHRNPLRAAMIVFLMRQEQKS